ncbi:hypothetical protein FRC19_001052 [Serendipita sp. 401]|nr:hypothetical protein FRC19_001052 [Serendipita sp. 401]
MRRENNLTVTRSVPPPVTLGHFAFSLGPSHPLKAPSGSSHPLTPLPSSPLPHFIQDDFVSRVDPVPIWCTGRARLLAIQEGCQHGVQFPRHASSRFAHVPPWTFTPGSPVPPLDIPWVLLSVGTEACWVVRYLQVRYRIPLCCRWEGDPLYG